MQSIRENSGFRRFQKSHCNYPCHVLFFHLFYLLTLHPEQSLPSSSPLPSPPLPPPSLLRERGDLPWISTHLGISSSRRTRHILGDQIVNVSINLSFTSNLLGSKFFAQNCQQKLRPLTIQTFVTCFVI